MTTIRWTARFTLVELPSGRLRLVRKPKHFAFTLVELLVVIAIIGILVALLAAGHSGGSRVGPENAVHQSDPSAHAGAAESPRHQERLSAGRAYDPVERPPLELFTYPRVTWMMHTFPFMEEGALFGAFNLRTRQAGAPAASGWIR